VVVVDELEAPGAERQITVAAPAPAAAHEGEDRGGPGRPEGELSGARRELDGRGGTSRLGTGLLVGSLVKWPENAPLDRHDLRRSRGTVPHSRPTPFRLGVRPS
jgi:hypothetical protein